MRRSWIMCRALAALVALLLLQSRACAQADIDNGIVRLGVNTSGSLIIVPQRAPLTSAGGTSGLGIRYMPTNNEAAAPAAPLEGWGVAVLGGTTFGGAVAGTPVNLAAVTFTSTATTANSVVTAMGIYRVTHAFTPSVHPNIYQIAVTVQNIGPTPVTTLYRRTVDWDVEPTALNEFVTIQGATLPGVVNFTNSGFSSQDPNSPPAGVNGDVLNSGPADLGSTITLNLGTLAPGASTTFNSFYGVTADRASAVTAVTTLGVSAYTFGQPSGGGPNAGTPNTFIYGFFGGSGTPPTPPTPPPSPGDEGSFKRSAGPTGGSEGGFGSGGSSGLTQLPPLPLPPLNGTALLSGPFAGGPALANVFNVSHKQAQARQAELNRQSGADDDILLAAFLLAAVALGALVVTARQAHASTF